MICPECGADWTGPPIPQDIRHHYGDQTHFSRRIGIELKGIYDGVIVWKCPDCGHMKHRFSGETVTDITKVTRTGIKKESML